MNYAIKVVLETKPYSVIFYLFIVVLVLCANAVVVTTSIFYFTFS